jgi:hypothetical protein
VYSAENYKFKGESFEEICNHNANVALQFKKYDVLFFLELNTNYKSKILKDILIKKKDLQRLDDF